MADVVREFVEKQTYQTITQMISDWEYFSETGEIGNCVLRQKAHELMKSLNCNTNFITVWMKDLAMECYRNRYIRLSKELSLLYNNYCFS